MQGATSLGRSFSYYDTGEINQATDVNGAVVTFTYGSGTSCGNSFPTTVAEPLSLSRSATWNCSGGVQTTATDENGLTTTETWTDPYFWRLAKYQDQSGFITNYAYASQNSTESSMLFNSNNSATDILTTYDAFGRTTLTQKRQGPSSSNFDSVETDYNNEGEPERTTLPFIGTAGNLNATAPGSTMTFDALGRMSQTNTSGGETIVLNYVQNDAYRTLGPAPTGENTKQKQLEYDALGRLSSVCEVTSLTGSGSCAQTSPVTGYWTKYTYDALNDLTGVTQNAQAVGSQQSRSYSYDGLGRLTSETTPEYSAAVTYTYDSDATCGSSAGDLVKKVDAVGNINCYSYDALHRMTSSSVSSGSYATVTAVRNFVYHGATVNSVAMAYPKTRLAEAYTCGSPCSTKLTDLGFSYNKRGDIADVYESTPNSGGYYHVTSAYDGNHAVTSIGNLTGLPNFTIGLDGEGRNYSVSASSGQYPLTSASYNADSEATQVNFGSGDNDVYTYDPNTFRMKQYQFNVSGQAVTSNLTWNAIGTMQQLATTDALYSPGTMTCTYTNDDLSRIASANCGTPWSQTFSYDAFGNISKFGSISFQPTYNPQTNRMTRIGSSTPTYDNNGKVLNDTAHAYTWDANGRPVGIDSASITFDALGRMAEDNQGGDLHTGRLCAHRRQTRVDEWFDSR